MCDSSPAYRGGRGIARYLLKKNMLFPILAPLFDIGIGILAFLTTDTALPVIGLATGIALALVGLVQGILYLMRSTEENFTSNGFITGAILLVMGVTLIFRRDSAAQFVPFALALCIAFNGLRELQNAIDIWKIKLWKPGVVIGIALVNLVFGIVMMINLGLKTGTLMKVLGVGLVVSAVIDFVTTLFILARTKKLEKERKARQAAAAKPVPPISEAVPESTAP